MSPINWYFILSTAAFSSGSSGLETNTISFDNPLSNICDKSAIPWWETSVDDYDFCLPEVRIVSVQSGLVFDGNGWHVKAVTPKNNSETQKWLLQRSRYDYFFIVNAKNKKALDVEEGCGNGHNIIVFEKQYLYNQQFYINCDGTIETSCGGKLIFQIDKGKVKTVPKSKSSGLDVHFQLVPSVI